MRKCNFRNGVSIVLEENSKDCIVEGKREQGHDDQDCCRKKNLIIKGLCGQVGLGDNDTKKFLDLMDEVIQDDLMDVIL